MRASIQLDVVHLTSHSVSEPYCSEIHLDSFLYLLGLRCLSHMRRQLVRTTNLIVAALGSVHLALCAQQHW